MHYTDGMRKALAVRVPEAADDWIREMMGYSVASRTMVVQAMLGVAAQHPNEVASRLDRYRGTEFKPLAERMPR